MDDGLRKCLSGRGCGASALAAKEKRERTEHYIKLVNLGNAAGKRPRELSGGMRQRVAVARGLAMDPKVLLMDEPFSALDALTRGTLQEELARIWMETQKTVVMITNDIDEAILLADTIYTLTGSPGATLGPAVRVEAPHPRSRSQLSREPAINGRGARLSVFSSPDKMAVERGRARLKPSRHELDGKNTP